MWFDILRGLVLGAVQGLTEFFPVSSSGHLILVPILLHWPDQGLAFDAFLNFGTITALLWFFRKDLWQLCVRLCSKNAEERRKAWVFASKIIVATIPGAVLGFLFKDIVAQYARHAWVVAADTAVWALVLLWADHASRKRTDSLADFEQVTWKQALTVGCAQAIAIAPGTSRSGITITAGLFTGLSREAAARFSFFLSIPINTAAALLGLVSVWKHGTGTETWPGLIVGYVAALVFGLFAIRFLLTYVAKKHYDWFVAYRLFLALVVVLVA
jgi:undecaprenyl-diphosphatase